MEKQTRAYLCAVFVVLFWSTIASAIKISFRYLDVLPLLFFASFVSTFTFFLYLLFFRKLNLIKALSQQDYFRSAMLGFLNPFLYYIVLLRAYSILPAQQAQPINFVWPITLVLLSIPLLKQKIRAKDFLSIIIGFTGVLIISTRGYIANLGSMNPLGVSLALGSTIIWSLYWIYNVKSVDPAEGRNKRDEAVVLFLNFAFGSFYIFITMILFSGFKDMSFRGLLGAAYIGLFEMGITYLLWLKALKFSKTTAHIANLIYLVPFLSLVVVHFSIGEEILLSTIFGLIFIVTGIILQKI
jgi:drug/metabolite transporter (DMT)-like permease